VKKSAVSSAVALALGVALLLAVAVAGAATARSQATTIELSTALSSAQEVPTPTGDVGGARGTFSATVTKSATGATVTWELTFSGLTGPVNAAHIHTGARGVAGPVVVPLCGPCESPVSGTASVDASVLSAIQTGQAYVNVHTPTNKAGEIRGQLAATAAVTTALAARQEVPKPKGNVRRARGTFTATVTKSGTTGRITWRLTFSRLTGPAAAAHIHLGARGKAGPVAVTLCGPCRSGVRKSATLSASVLTALESGRAYVNIHTARNPAGEIRGQIRAVPLSIS
jgi:CHRD domain-containing protein